MDKLNLLIQLGLTEKDIGILLECVNVSALPDIVPLPPVIDSLITGALITFSSKTMANLLPTFFVVTLPNFCAPNLSKVKDTIGSLL